MLKGKERATVLLIVAAFLAFGSKSDEPLRADEPTVQALIERIPDLTPENEELTAFSFELTSRVPFEMPFETTVLWRKDGNVGLLTTAGESKSPVWFLSGSKAAVFDVCTGNVLVKENARIKVDIRFVNDELKLDYGIASGEQHHAAVRLRTLFEHADFRDGTLVRAPEGDYSLESKVSERGFRTVALFDSEEPHPLRGLRIERAEGRAELFRIDDLRIGEEVREAWPAFPDQFPEGVDVFGPGKKRSAPDAYTQWLWLTRAQIGYAAIRETKWREAPVVAGVDWSAANELSKKFASIGSRLVTEARQEEGKD